MSQRWDAIIIGAGHNGLVAAGYLAKEGLKTLVLERRAIVGGACVTEEIYPGFRLSTAAYAAGLLRPKIIKDLQLHNFGLHQWVKDPSLFIPFPDGKHIFIWRDRRKTEKQIERFSKRDAKAYFEFEKFWEEVFELVDPTLLMPPPPLPELVSLLRGPEAEDLLRKILLMSAKDLLDETFESEYVKATMVGNAVIGTDGGPMTPGTAYVLGHHLIGEIDGVKGVWGWAKGGMGNITQALAAAAEHYGATIRTNVEVKKISVRNQKAEGVELASGEKIFSETVLSNADPKRTFLGLVDPDQLEKDFVKKVEKIKMGGVVLKMNCAIDRVPDFKAFPGDKPGPQHMGTIDICPSVEYLEKAYDDAKYGKPSEKPFIESFIQSAVDDTVAPPGKHTLSMFVQYAPYRLREGSWEDEKERFGQRIIDTLVEYAPNMAEAFIHKQILTPVDLETQFGLTGGDIFHMAITPDQILSFRPVPGWSNYRTPIKGLYLCGSGAHPGGGILGAPGHNAAQEVLKDIRKK